MEFDEDEYVEEPILEELWYSLVYLLDENPGTNEEPGLTFHADELYALLIEKPPRLISAFLLRAQGCTQQNIADRLHVNQTTVKRWFDNQLKDVRDYLVRELGLAEPFKEKDFKHKRGRPPKYQPRNIPGVTRTDEWLEGYQFSKK